MYYNISLFKRFCIIGGSFLGALLLFFILLYIHDQQQEFEADLQNGYGVMVTGTVNAIGGKINSEVVTASYRYHGYEFNREIGNFDPDSIAIGTKVRLLISGLHPTNALRYIGVDTMATRQAHIALSGHHKITGL